MAGEGSGEGAPQRKGGRRVFGLPLWAVAVGVGALAGGWWFIRRARQQSTAADTSSGQATGTGADTPTIVPVDQGLSESQYQALLSAIKGINGAPSTAPDDDDDHTGQGGGPLPIPPGSHVPKPPRPPAKTPRPPAKPGGPAYEEYTVKGGDDLVKIAHRFHTTAAALWAYNIGPHSPHTKAAIATMKRRGPDDLVRGEKIFIPKG